jgi:DNA repair exonuclease SbcCD ATPase subunit
LAESLSNGMPPCLDHLGLDRVVRACLCKDRAGRMQRMQQVKMELKLLAASERRSEPGVALRQTQIEAALRGEIQQLESRWASRFEQQKETFADLQCSLAEERSESEQQQQAVADLQRALAEAQSESGQQRQAVVDLQRELAEARSGSEQQQETVAGLQRDLAEARSGLEAASAALKATSTQLGEVDGRVAAVQERLAGAEQAATGVRGEMTGIQSKLAGEIQGLCQKVDAQAAAIQSARNSVTRTDDLVERVVDALEFLQSTVLEQSGDRMALAS